MTTGFIYNTGNSAVLPNGFLIGNAQNAQAATGCTAIICEHGAIGSVKVLGGAPATRETNLLDSENAAEAVHAVVLSGGSAFGLDSSTGVMQCLESRGVGLQFMGSVVPIVVGASLFDLGVGNGQIRPDTNMGFAAAELAFSADSKIESGNVGAGCGGSVGKFFGQQTAMKSGLGLASASFGELVVTAVVAVNALGNVYDRQQNKWLAGAIDPGSLATKPQILDPYLAFGIMSSASIDASGQDNAAENTTIGCILTNAKLTKPQAARTALMAHDGYARSIEPVHTSFDGDAIFCLSYGTALAMPDLVGTLAAKTMELAIHNSVLSADGAYGLLANRDL